MSVVKLIIFVLEIPDLHANGIRLVTSGGQLQNHRDSHVGVYDEVISSSDEITFGLIFIMTKRSIPSDGLDLYRPRHLVMHGNFFSSDDFFCGGALNEKRTKR